MKQIECFTDGACRGNPGPGGWGVVMLVDGEKRTYFGGERQTTNNQMELQAAIEALKQLSSPHKVSITTDSQYVRKGITEWIIGWQRNGWRNSQNKPVKNQDRWQVLLALVAKHQVEWYWVKGHSGHPENELADQLANQGIDEGIGL